jgi:hypothetical protein
MSTIAKQAPTLFDGDDRLFRQEVAACRVYGEYGCGSSTIWIAHRSNARIQAVDSSPAWIARLAGPRPTRPSGSRSRRSISASWATGRLGDWGYPTTFRHRFRD